MRVCSFLYLYCFLAPERGSRLLNFYKDGKHVGLYAGEVVAALSWKKAMKQQERKTSVGKERPSKANGGWMLDSWRARGDIMFFMKP